ncbi:urea transporter [Neobacillus piezotolerans]|uniref:Urea transporter n=1 Tax=Neobacillus piezotolerans TaxID=2259171 RepID=A0A3D8GR25_9BACI|nr:urea transporter [Neobacillus piezotolerans]RDU36742.1 urea transporter [Neobacillus piezotolerans]
MEKDKAVLSWNEGKIKTLIVETLRGLSQVLLIENAISGMIILLAITIASYKLAIIAFISSLIGTLVAQKGRADGDGLSKGLFGYNSVLTGLALFMFLSGPNDWIIALFGAAAAAILTAVMMFWMRNTKIPILTAPYILLTWSMLLVSYRLKSFQLSQDLVPQSLAHWKLNIKGEINWIEGAVSGLSQIFFIDHTAAGVLLFAAVIVAGWRYALFAVLGNVIALFTAYWLGGEHTLIYEGHYGYNAILAAIAAAYVFRDKKGGIPHLLSGIIAAFLTVPLTASLDTWLMPYGLPALTMPFVFTTWIILLVRKVLPGL